MFAQTAAQADAIRLLPRSRSVTLVVVGDVSGGSPWCHSGGVSVEMRHGEGRKACGRREVSVRAAVVVCVCGGVAMDQPQQFVLHSRRMGPACAITAASANQSKARGGGHVIIQSNVRRARPPCLSEEEDGQERKRGERQERGCTDD
uniref:Uncharacterized protein n=1 Tax=Knipowitschia caucasica TaxID=637954 RepID=A0AAV2KF98_KNICA